MAVMKDISHALASLGYDPTAVTLADVLRPEPGETEARRIARLVVKATIEGCMVFALANDTGRFAVTSGSASGTAYIVDPYAGECSCDSGGWRLCKHLALTLLELGELVVEPAAAVAAAWKGCEEWTTN